METYHIRGEQSLGLVLRTLREQHGWTQAQLAEHLGTTRQYIYDLEIGKHTLIMERLFTTLELFQSRMMIEEIRHE